MMWEDPSHLNLAGGPPPSVKELPSETKNYLPASFCGLVLGLTLQTFVHSFIFQDLFTNYVH